MARTKDKNKAIALRRKGLSINEITERVHVPKSTVSVWCRDIPLSVEQIKRLAEKQLSGSYKGRMKFLERVRRERIKETGKLRMEGLKEIGKMNKRDLFIAGVAMYVSEGYTYEGGDQVAFTNSDPKIILFVLEWFHEICKVPLEDLSLSIRINVLHKNRIKEVESYWSRVTSIPLIQFRKTILIKTKAKKIYPNYNTHYGTLRVLVRRGTKVRRKINGWIEGLLMGV